MSWSGFKKNVGRKTTQVMMKTGHVEKTSDREYEVEERRYRTLESASLRLQKEAKGYLDSLRAMTASQMRIAETIDAFYGDSGARDGVSRSYKQAVEDLDAETIKALDGPYRCVPEDLRILAWDDEEGVEDVAELRLIEWEMNYVSAQTQPARMTKELSEYEELIDSVYRQTVLEPINRFCAYFPDINECIKKRNHKMLDYDALRSKVKKLTEKPDKDASKLPRTEKELEMVSATHLVHRTPPLSPASNLPVPMPLKRKFFGRGHSANATTPTDRDSFIPDLDFPSPPKILNGIARTGVEKPATSPKDSTSTGRNIPSPLKINPSPAHEVEAPEESPSLRAWMVRNMKNGRPNGEHDKLSPQRPELESRGFCLGDLDLQTFFETLKHTKPPESSSGTGLSRSLSLARNSLSPSRRNSFLHKRSASTSKRTPSLSTPFSVSSTPPRRSFTAAPFFNPSDLEDILRPVKEKFLKEGTDTLSQAKAAYDQLNDQLTSELPQLIDLRVPYLDPSFEALVKIQLRFCAEAYSRMAQVQQYLDASTRDQYASGELDARVEDVLGQIRELSIAGTV